MSQALKLTDLTKHFGGVYALQKVNLYVNEGELVGLLGPNGSGKTTLFNCVAGFYRPDDGRVFLKGKEITGWKMEKISELGLYRTFQLPRVFPELTLLQNVLLSQSHRNESLLDVMFRKSPEAMVKRAETHIDFVGLGHLTHAPAGSLSGGQQKLLELASALMKDPEVILLDEPTGGVNPTLINEIKKMILKLNSAGKTFLIIEHNMDVIMDIAQRLYVLDYGELIAEGSSEDIRNNDRVLDAYFGR
ncbi:MAG: ABC transporter ATP-binding protein [Deltaproteobacteria bacterium]|nr:ABC transporter ATP-binding protein [Deltaproteobacteria bacterium]MBW2153973.1 ABC transporter ATP-binding protein [Deltaproteobacteria bacterium]